MAGLAAAVAPGSERVLLCGDTKGKFRLLVRLLQQVQQRQGPFGAVICCGSFFGGPPASNSGSGRQCGSGSPSHSSKNASGNSSGRDGAITGGENTTVNDTSCTSSSPATRGETAAPTSCSSSTTKATEDRGSLAESAAATGAAAAGAAAAGAAAAGAAAAAAPLSPSVVEKAAKGGATTDSVSSRSLAPEGGGTAAAADVAAGAGDAAANPAAKGAEAATASLSTVVKDAYPQEFNELQEAAVKLPMPLYFIDEQVSSLVPVGWYGQGEACGGDGALSSPPGTPSRLSCAAADAANPEVHAGYAVPEATAATAAAPAKFAVSADAAAPAAGEDQAGGPATRKATAETDTDKQQTGFLSPQQVCSNVFWLGRAGLARVSGLKVALCALSNADEQLLLQHEQQEPQHEQQEQQHEQKQPQQEQQHLQQEQQQQQQEEQELQEEEDLGHEVEEGSLKRRRLIRGTSCVAGSSTAAVPSARPTCAAAAALPAAEATPAAEAAGTGPVLSAPATAPAPAAPSSPCAPTAAAARGRAWWHEVVAAAASPEWEGRVDIFVSCRWPADVLQQMQPLPTSFEATASDSSNEAAEKLQALLRKIGVDRAVVERGSSVLAAHLAAILEPRYLFAGSAGVFYQRLPFRSPLYGYVSRFTSLGIVGAKTPETKPLHALQLQPIDALLAAVPGERFPGALRPLPFHRCSVRGSNASSSNHLSSGDITDGSDASATSNRLCGCVGKEEAAAGAAEEERAKAETARAALSTLPSNSTASPFIGFLPSATQQELLQQASKRLLPPSTDPSAAGDAIAAGATYRTSSRADTASSLLGPRPSSSVSSSTAGASVPPPPPPSQAGGPRQGQQQRQQQPPRRCCVVCVCNLPYNVDEASLQKVMEAFGEVKFIYAPRDSQDSSKGTGKAFVVFVEPQSAEKAVEASGQLEAGRRVLRVAFWREKIPFAHRQQQQQKQLPKAGTVLVTEAHAECWFCLANPKVEKHLVAAVGDACYVAAPKGGLHPLHALVVPITHFPSVAFAPAEVREEVGRQVEAYRRALKQQENMDCIVYERYVPMRTTKAMHTQVQCVPCTTAQGYRAAEFFKKKAKAVGITLQPLDCTQSSLPFSELPQLVTGTERAYFYLDLPGLNTASGHRAERLFYCQPNPGNTTSAAGGNRGGRPDYIPRLPMNFGRDVVATVIDKPEMADWQNCTEDQSQETTRAARLTRLLSE